jgi:hypothetical protein
VANWAWPHTPASYCARLRLAGGPFDGEEVAFLPPDHPAPVQVVWSGWSPQGFTAWLYEWHGETTTDRGRTDALVYRATGRRVAVDEIPPLVAEDVELWAGAPAVWADAMRAIGIPADLMWPGV